MLSHATKWNWQAMAQVSLWQKHFARSSRGQEVLTTDKLVLSHPICLLWNAWTLSLRNVILLQGGPCRTNGQMSKCHATRMSFFSKCCFSMWGTVVVYHYLLMQWCWTGSLTKFAKPRKFPRFSLPKSKGTGRGMCKLSFWWSGLSGVRTPAFLFDHSLPHQLFCKRQSRIVPVSSFLVSVFLEVLFYHVKYVLAKVSMLVLPSISCCIVLLTFQTPTVC